jgi:hypothetical protein
MNKGAPSASSEEGQVFDNLRSSPDFTRRAAGENHRQSMAAKATCFLPVPTRTRGIRALMAHTFPGQA